jgi:hypothetical protein
MSGKRIRGATITSANIADYLPSPETVSRSAALFEKLGFRVSNAVANNFAISASPRVFEKVFGVRLTQTEKGSVKATPKGAKVSGYELPLSTLPREVRELLEAVTFTPPPDFGPTSW